MSILSGRNTTRPASKADTDIWGVDRFERTSPAMQSVPDGSATVRESSGGLGTSDGKRSACGNPDCAAGWTKPWKSRRRPIFEGRWACGSKCLLAMVRGAVRREAGDAIASMPVAPHRHRVPLGLVMLAQGWITQPQLRRALDGQKTAGGKIGEWLQQDCHLSPQTVTRGLSMQWNCPVLTTEGFDPRALALVLPRVFVRDYGILPLRIAAARLLYLAFEDKLDASAAFAAQQMSDLKVESGLVESEALQQARERLLKAEFVEATEESVRDSEQMAARIAELLEERQPIAARLVRMQRHYWLRTWLEAGAHGAAGTIPVSSEDVFDTVFRVGS